VKLIPTLEAAAAASVSRLRSGIRQATALAFYPTANFGVKLNIVPRNGVEKGAVG
jgi:hypothetical protein